MNQQKRLTFFFFFSIFIFLAINYDAYYYAYLSVPFAVASAACTIVFLLLSYVYLTRIYKIKAPEERIVILYYALFILILVTFLSTFLVNLNLSGSLLLHLGSLAYHLGIFFILFLPIYFLVVMGAYLYKYGKQHRPGLILFGVTLAILFIMFLSGVLFKPYGNDDETLIQLASGKALLTGVNPYAINITRQVIQNSSEVGVTITTTNSAIGILDYPALFFMSVAPFYTLSNLLFGSITQVFNIEISFFILLLFLAFAFCLEKNETLKPKFAILIFFGLFIEILPSMTVFLMLALLLITYFRINSKYAFILMGLCLSLQEELWIPVVFLMLYSLNNKGIKSGLKDIVGAVIVFLLINGYFIVINPGLYFEHVFTPLGSYIFPNGYAALGYAIISVYHTMINVYPYLFLITIAALAVIFVYVNKKILIPLFCIIPFLFLDHALEMYYSFFLLLLVMVLYEKDDGIKKRAVLSKYLRRNPAIVALSLLVLIAIALVLVYGSHQSFVNNFNLSVTNQSVVSYKNFSIYRGTIVYGKLSNYTLYTLMATSNGYNVYLNGLFGENITANPQPCIERVCINTNKISLNPNNHSYQFVANVPWPNSTTPTTYASAIFYNGPYYIVFRSEQATK